MLSRGMAYSILFIRPFVFTHWVRPEWDDLETLREKVRRFHADTRAPLVSVTITDHRSQPPDPAMRKELVASTASMSDVIRAFYTVVGGSGFQATVMRSVLAGMFLIHRGPVRPKVARSVEEVLDREAGTFDAPREDILRRLREAELLLS